MRKGAIGAATAQQKRANPVGLPDAVVDTLIGRLPARATRLRTELPPGAGAVALCAALTRANGPGFALAVTAGPVELEALAQDWQTLCPSFPAQVLFPPDDPDESLDADSETLGALLETVRQIHETPAQTPALLLTCAQALALKLPDPQHLARQTLTVRVADPPGTEAEPCPLPDDPSELLAANGYQRSDSVVQKGEFAIRGGILDLWPPDQPHPLRIERFGSDVESLRTFDPATQRTTGRRTSVRITPARLPPSHRRKLGDLLPPGVRLLWLEPGRIAETLAFLTTPAPTSPKPPDAAVAGIRSPSLECHAGAGAPAAATVWALAWEAIPGLADTGAGGAPPDALASARQTLLETLASRARQGEQVQVFVDTPGVRDRLRETLARDSALTPHLGVLSGGFGLPAARYVLVAQSDLYGKRARADWRAAGARRGADTVGERIEAPEDLRPGDLVVHLDHGIGEYLELTEIDIGGQRAEVLTIRYAEDARLHVPATQSHLLSRYVGVAGQKVRLHRLGGKRWQRERRDAEQAVRDLAASLLETQAQRQTQQGDAFNVDPPWMHEFETAFPYPETPDQIRTLQEIKADLSAARPMDRLVCGDAGYGKTEMAIRAAFIAVMQGRQVAVLTPTTVLAEQHDRTFRDRLAPYPIRIETLSRFRGAAQRQAIRRGLADGGVDLVIGTHALLQPDITFRDLGLLVIDEEQRFGVAHKERLKQVRRLVDVLTLTATPIPRTLYMSMTGARDMSLLQTPPRQRQAVETRVAEDRDDIIRQAILREVRREGQVFFLYNRVLTLPRMLQRLRQLVPEARIGVAHGQMPSMELARVMREFAEGGIDLLLCTTIVESGLDIPRANTILIHRADRFGIADLYQLRGRVGRSSRRAYAWLLLPPGGVTDPDARRRIEALQRHSGLGSGFQLALRDLEIRGAGNLLGAAQSGHIAAIGFGLYCQLLKRTIARLQGQAPPPLIDVALQLDFIDLSPAAPPTRGAALPYDYVSAEADRVALHKRLAEAATPADLRELRNALKDRFGPLPPPAERMLRLSTLRILAARHGIQRIEVRQGRLMCFREGHPLPRLPCLPEGNADTKLKALRRVLDGMPFP